MKTSRFQMHWFIENVDEIQHVKISTQNGFFFLTGAVRNGLTVHF